MKAPNAPSKSHRVGTGCMEAGSLGTFGASYGFGSMTLIVAGGDAYRSSPRPRPLATTKNTTKAKTATSNTAEVGINSQ